MFDNMSSRSGRSICYALLPWAFDLLCNQFDWGTQFRVPQNKNVQLSSQTLDYTLCDNAYINESGNETTISIPYRNMCTLCEVLMSEITVSFYALWAFTLQCMVAYTASPLHSETMLYYPQFGFTA